MMYVYDGIGFAIAGAFILLSALHGFRLRYKSDISNQPKFRYPTVGTPDTPDTEATKMALKEDIQKALAELSEQVAKLEPETAAQTTLEAVQLKYAPLVQEAKAISDLLKQVSDHLADLLGRVDIVDAEVAGKTPELAASIAEIPTA